MAIILLLNLIYNILRMYHTVYSYTGRFHTLSLDTKNFEYRGVLKETISLDKEKLNDCREL